MTVILHKRGSGVPTADAFHSVGEILIDTSTGMAYTLTDAGTVVALTGSHYTGADAVKLTGDQTVAGHKTYSDVATFGDTVFLRGLINGDSGANFGGEVTAQKFMSNSFTDMEGNPIGGGDGIPAEYDDAFVYEDPWRSEEVGAGETWVMKDGLSASHFQTYGHISAETAGFDKLKAVQIDTHAPFYGSVATAAGFFTQSTVFGGINVTALDQERPEELPFDLSDEELAEAKEKTRSIQHALTVTHETLGRTVEIDKEGIIRARQFTDMDGNPIGGGGVAPESIEATFYETVELVPTSSDTGGSTRPYKDVWVVDDNNGEGDTSRTNIYAAGEITARKIDAMTIKGYSAEFNSGFRAPAVISRTATTIEQIVAGGINVTATDVNFPELPGSSDEKSEKSIQNAFAVTHATLGRTVEIDKEGIIRALQFTDMDGNPMSVSPATMVEAFTTLQKAISDEDTLEGVKSALTNSLGGLIEKFEAMNDNG